MPDWLDKLVARMLLRDPEQRPWDGAEAAKRCAGVAEDALL